MEDFKLDSIEDALKDFREGKFVIVVDDEDRENVYTRPCRDHQGIG